MNFAASTAIFRNARATEVFIMCSRSVGRQFIEGARVKII